MKSKKLESVETVKFRRSVSLIRSDSIVLCLDHIQLFSIVLSLSLSWPWPLEWIKTTSFVFFANLDFWEFTKVHTVYQGREQTFPDPSTVPFSYYAYCAAWIIASVIVFVVMLVYYFTISRLSAMGPIQMILLKARLFYILCVGLQMCCLPFGITFIRIFDCQNYTNLDTGEEEYQSIVLRDTSCWSVEHHLIMVPFVYIAVGYFIIFPVWLAFRIRKELTFSSFCNCNNRAWKKHEQELVMVETEYVSGLDVHWATQNYAIFSSFRRPWAYFRPLSFINKVIILLIYGCFYYHQSIILKNYHSGDSCSISCLQNWSVQSYAHLQSIFTPLQFVDRNFVSTQGAKCSFGWTESPLCSLSSQCELDLGNYHMSCLYLPGEL